MSVLPFIPRCVVCGCGRIRTYMVALPPVLQTGEDTNFLITSIYLLDNDRIRILVTIININDNFFTQHSFLHTVIVNKIVGGTGRNRTFITGFSIQYLHRVGHCPMWSRRTLCYIHNPTSYG